MQRASENFRWLYLFKKERNFRFKLGMHSCVFYWSINGLLIEKSSGLKFHSIVYLLHTCLHTYTCLTHGHTFTNLWNFITSTCSALTHSAYPHTHCVPPNRISMRVTCFIQLNRRTKTTMWHKTWNTMTRQRTREICFWIVPQAKMNFSSLKMRNVRKFARQTKIILLKMLFDGRNSHPMEMENE